MRRVPVLSRPLAIGLLVALAAGAPLALAQNDSAKRPWVIAQDQDYAIAVPGDWTNLDQYIPKILVDRESDGRGGVPSEDENGAPVQAEILLEHVEMVPDLPTVGGVLISRILKMPRTEPLTQPQGRKLKLSDGSDAFLLWLEVSQPDSQTRKDRCVLYYKLLCKTDKRHGFVVTATLSAGKGSKIPSPDGKLGQWLGAMVGSFVRDPQKLDAARADEAYRKRDGR